MTTTKEFAVCKVCGDVVYRTSPTGPWLLGSDEMLGDIERDSLPVVACGCND